MSHFYNKVVQTLIQDLELDWLQETQSNSILGSQGVENSAEPLFGGTAGWRVPREWITAAEVRAQGPGICRKPLGMACSRGEDLEGWWLWQHWLSILQGWSRHTMTQIPVSDLRVTLGAIVRGTIFHSINLWVFFCCRTEQITTNLATYNRMSLLSFFSLVLFGRDNWKIAW